MPDATPRATRSPPACQATSTAPQPNRPENPFSHRHAIHTPSSLPLHARVRVHEAGENLDRDHRGGRVRLGKGAEQFIIFDSRAALFVTGEGSGSRRRQPTTTRCKRR